MGIPVYYDGSITVTPALPASAVILVRKILGQVHDPETAFFFEAVARTPEQDLPYYLNVLQVEDDGSLILPEEQESRHGVGSYLRLLIEHYLAPQGYVLNGTITWEEGSEKGDQGTMYVRDNQLEVVEDVCCNPGPSWAIQPYAHPAFIASVAELVSGEDSTGCSPDLTVVSASAVQKLQQLAALCG